uniref:RAB, member of RAS oncogene family like 2B n=1 Tax=Pseudonaja textilis TaxID=8673 RepID=A0A670ZMN2_PSETE
MQGLGGLVCVEAVKMGLPLLRNLYSASSSLKTTMVSHLLSLTLAHSKPQQLSTFALTLYKYTATVDGKTVLVDFWDTAGQERFQSMHASYYHKAHACIMVFDVQRKVTYKNLTNWYKELREFRPQIPCIVVANKIDADLKATQKSFNFPKKLNLPLYFVSAADGTNVVKLFSDAIKMAVAYKQNSGDFMDEVLKELDVRGAPWAALWGWRPKGPPGNWLLGGVGGEKAFQGASGGSV